MNVQAVPVSGCGVGDYSSVMRWMVVGVVSCKTWRDSLTVLLNSSSSAASHSSSNVGRSGEQYPWRRARSITELMRCWSDALVKPRHVCLVHWKLFPPEPVHVCGNLPPTPTCKIFLAVLAPGLIIRLQTVVSFHWSEFYFAAAS